MYARTLLNEDLVPQLNHEHCHQPPPEPALAAILSRPKPCDRGGVEISFPPNFCVREKLRGKLGEGFTKPLFDRCCHSAFSALGELPRKHVSHCVAQHLFLA